jgi:predicted DNA binding CopG/RHH family protein
MKKKLKTIPKFKTEAEERTFWEGHDSMEYIDWSPAKNVRFPNVKPSTQAISLRLPLSLLEKIKVEANRRDVPYQSLIKVWLGEKVEPSPPVRTSQHPRSNTRRGSTVS